MGDTTKAEPKKKEAPKSGKKHGLSLLGLVAVLMVISAFLSFGGFPGFGGMRGSRATPPSTEERASSPEGTTQSDCPDFTSTLNVCRVTESGSGWMRKAPDTSGQWLWDIDDMSNLAEVWYLDGSGQERRYNLNGRGNDQAYAWRFVPKPGKAIAVRYRIG